MAEEPLYRKDENGKFVEVEAAQETPEPLPLLEFSTDHGEGDHYYIDKGIQDDPDWKVRCVVCRDCPHGMEIGVDDQVVDGKIVWAPKTS